MWQFFWLCRNCAGKLCKFQPISLLQIPWARGTGSAKLRVRPRRILSTQNLHVAVNFKPFEAAEMDALREQCRSLAADGRLELFKMTTKYDGKVGREQHHFPTVQELPF
jgi:hypothetical protein